MWRHAITLVLALPAVFLGVAAAADTGKNLKVRELIRLHDLKTSVSIGHCYLKQESLLAAREMLGRIGRDEALGPDWNPKNPFWQRAEGALIEHAMQQVDRDFVTLEWLGPLWEELGSTEFSDQELNALLAHLRSAVGRKQAQIVDHTVSTHVMMALSFSGKFKEVPGIEHDRARMQAMWTAEDEQMRFSIADADNADGQAFALSPLGKKYFVTAVLKLTGIVNRRLGDMALHLPREVAAQESRIRPFVEHFKSARG